MWLQTPQPDSQNLYNLFPETFPVFLCIISFHILYSSPSLTHPCIFRPLCLCFFENIFYIFLTIQIYVIYFQLAPENTQEAFLVSLLEIVAPFPVSSCHFSFIPICTNVWFSLNYSYLCFLFFYMKGSPLRVSPLRSSFVSSGPHSSPVPGPTLCTQWGLRNDLGVELKSDFLE